MKIKLIVDGGAMKPGPAVSQQLGPLGLNLGKIMADVNTATEGFKGMQVPVELDVNAKDKTYEIHVSSPSVATLLKKELGVEKGSGKAAEVKVGNLAIEQVISISQTKLPNLLAKDLKAAVKQVVGTCVSLGILIENKPAVEIEEDITSGKYDSQIKEGKTDVSPDKKKNLDTYFNNLKNVQDKAAKAAEEAKAAEDAAKAAEAAAAPPAEAAPAAAGAKKDDKAAKPAAKKK